jgi:hypothetical protein
MAWHRYGQIYAPSGAAEWASTHASLPTPVRIGEDTFRFFFSTRDSQKRSSIAWVDVELADPPRVVAEAESAALAFGTPGMFDDSGVSIGSVVPAGSNTRLYYMGWNLGVVAPWRNSIGVAQGDPKRGHFERIYTGPIMDRSPEDPFTLSYPWVLRLGETDWRMWYGSNTKWGAKSADMHHVIKAAYSKDGFHWSGKSEISLTPSSPGEYAFARPAVLYDLGRFRMWFAVRGERYRIGYAESQDGLNWTRADEAFGLVPSVSGWDSEMTCYPCPFTNRDKLYLAYNGNRYGQTGFGLAVWKPAGS